MNFHSALASAASNRPRHKKHLDYFAITLFPVLYFVRFGLRLSSWRCNVANLYTRKAFSHIQWRFSVQPEVDFLVVDHFYSLGSRVRQWWRRSSSSGPWPWVPPPSAYGKNEWLLQTHFNLIPLHPFLLMLDWICVWLSTRPYQKSSSIANDKKTTSR